jgi:hypothetical protein
MNKTLTSAVALLAALALPSLSLAQDASSSVSVEAQTQTSVSASTETGASASTETGAGASTSASASTETGGTSTNTGVQTDLNVNITTEQATEIKQVITQVNVAPVSINFEINLGVVVPKTVKLVALPARIVEIVPAFKGFLFFVLADGRIIIVAPDTLKIVAILVI